MNTGDIYVRRSICSDLHHPQRRPERRKHEPKERMSRDLTHERRTIAYDD